MTILSERQREARARCLAAPLLVALIGFGPAAAAAADSVKSYPPGPGDTLQIAVYGQDPLSGRFQIAPDGTITYPLIGALAASGLSTAEIAKRIGAELVKRFPTGDAVTVSVAERAPVFIVGDVTKPGQYQYRPGMIALELVALGEGFRSPSALQDATQLQMLDIQQDYADTRIQRFAQNVRRSRIAAEIAGSDFGYAIPDTAPARDRAALQRIVDGEGTVFRTRRDSLASQKSALQAQQQSFQREITTLEESLKLQTEEIVLLQEDVSSSQALASRGLTTRIRLREAQRQLSQSKRDMLDQEARLSRANQSQLDLAQRLVDLRSARMDENANALREIDVEIARADQKLLSLQTTLAALQTESAGAGHAVSTTTDYTIVRVVDGDYREIQATERTEIRPGDILRAQRKISLGAAAALSLN